MAFLEMTYFFGWMKIMNVKMNASQGIFSVNLVNHIHFSKLYILSKS